MCKRLERGLFARINPFHSGDIVLTQAEFSLFFEGADLNKRFIESPPQIRKSSQQLACMIIRQPVFHGALLGPRPRRGLTWGDQEPLESVVL